MQRDHGFIGVLMEESENERMRTLRTYQVTASPFNRHWRDSDFLLFFFSTPTTARNVT